MLKNGSTYTFTPPDSDVFKWDNSKYFAGKTKEGFWDWASWPETWDGKQLATWGLFAISGFSHGIGEVYHADPYIFEKRHGVASESFFGSDAWKRNYYNNDVDKGHKHEFFGNVGRDVWHTANFFDSTPLITGCVIIPLRGKIPVKYRLANLAVGIAGRMLVTQAVQKYYR